jgi:hypothetical protein
LHHDAQPMQEACRLMAQVVHVPCTAIVS